MKQPGLRILVLLGLLAAPVLLAVGSQALAARPGPPEPPVRSPIVLDYATPEGEEPAAPQEDGTPRPGEDGDDDR